MRVLISGHLGFVGSETKRYVERMSSDNQVIGYDIMEKNDIRDAQQFDEFVTQHKPDRILHLAAIARFADADKDPKLAFETNVMGTQNVVLVAKKHKIPLVYSSTGSAAMPLDDYEPPFDETIPARGNSPYGCTKAAGEYYVQEHNPHIILRYSHLLGAEKKFHGLVGGFISRIERGLAPRLYGGLQTNDFCYIKDIARANYLALTADWSSWNQIYNIGTGTELSAEEAGKIVCDVFGYKGKIQREKGRTVDPSRFVFNCKKAENMLGFKYEFGFREALEAMKKEMQYAPNKEPRK